MKVQQLDIKLSKIAHYLGQSILLLCYRIISDFLENNFGHAGESACVNIVVSLTGSIGYIWLAGRIYANPRHLPLYYPPLFAQCTDHSFGIEFARSLRRHFLSWILNFAPEVN